jgi:NAD(P)-dependent dehydrogenase (short-subunit alcohol dehydrogenase family)
MNRILVITGASRGIGLATAQLFAQNGYTVCNLSRSPSPLPGVLHINTDLGAANWVEQVSAPLLRAVAGAGQIALVHNAGSIIKDSLREFSAEDFRRVFEINVVAPARLTHLLLPAMRPGSSIIYVGSTLSEIAVPNSCSYVTSKHALIGLMRSTCQDLAGTGIHTAGICPGFTDTEMLRAHVGNSAEVLAAIAGGVAQNRLIEADEIAAAIHFCAQSPVINGAVIHANLGQINA